MTSVSTQKIAKNDDGNIEIDADVNAPKKYSYLQKKDNKLFMNKG